MPRILVVEDNHDLRILLQIALQNEGYEVSVACDGQEALDLLTMQENLPPALILLDLMMPRMDGWQFLEAMDKNPSISAIPVVVCSASKEPMPDHVDFLKKPIELSTLLTVVERHCGQ